EAADQAHAIELPGAFLETADEQHVVIEFFLGFRVAFGSFRHGFWGPVFFGFGKAETGCGKAQTGWQEHCYLFRCTFRTVFGVPEMLLRQGVPPRQDVTKPRPLGALNWPSAA